jgi:hypothetical protein
MVSIETIRLNIQIRYSDGSIKRHNFNISGFMFRQLKIIYNNKLYLRTKTELLKWVNNIAGEIKCTNT